MTTGQGVERPVRPKPDRRLDEGAEGDDVRRLQQALTSLGIDAGPIDGRFGGQTRRGVMRFQKMIGVDADGVLDEPARGLLFHPVANGRPDLLDGGRRQPTGRRLFDCRPPQATGGGGDHV